jgi:DNA-binding transcriptional regulator YiaG
LRRLVYRNSVTLYETPGLKYRYHRPAGTPHGAHRPSHSSGPAEPLNQAWEPALEPEEIRRIRKKLGPNQARAAELIGGGPRAFQKYEAGDLTPNQATGSALSLLDHAPRRPRVLEARHHAGAAQAAHQPGP